MAKCSLSLEYLKVTEAMAKCNLSLNYSQKIFWLDWTYVLNFSTTAMNEMSFLILSTITANIETNAWILR